MKTIVSTGLLLLAVTTHLSGADLPMDKPLPGLGDYVEKDFPFLTSSLDLRGLGKGLPEDNLAVRGLHVRLGDHWACFDTDLLRFSAIWRGDFQELRNMAHTSYKIPGKKTAAGQEKLARLKGDLLMVNGLYAGAREGGASFGDPRASFEDDSEIGRGPLPRNDGQFLGHRIHGDRVQLRYRVGGAVVHEVPLKLQVEGGYAIQRHIEVVQPSGKSLAIVIGEVGEKGSLWQESGSVRMTVPDRIDTRVMLATDASARLRILEKRYLVLEYSEGAKGVADVLISPARLRPQALHGIVLTKADLPDFSKGGPGRWGEPVETTLTLSDEDTAYVVDHFHLPMPNPWKRNVRPSALGFHDDGRAVVCTIDGDVWGTSAIGKDVRRIKWHRVASGLSEPMGLVVRDREVLVFSRGGITLLRDFNGDGETDDYEMFCDLPAQSGETREFPMDMKLGPDGSLYIAKGGIHHKGRGIMNGTIIRVSPDGSYMEVVADGLREPFIGLNPRDGFLTSSDQQGNRVPSTPLYHVEQDDYFGFHWAGHRDKEAKIPDPITWIPHMADNSGASQIWVHSESMGPLNGAMLHLSYGRPALFRTYIHKGEGFVQGAVVEIPTSLRVPILQASLNPRDGFPYLCGLQIYGSNARILGGFCRLRYTGRESLLPANVEVFKEGVLLSFDLVLQESSSTQIDNYLLRRWNYERTDKYGSPHFKLDGKPGQDDVRINSAQISKDGRSVFLVVPDMRKVMQLALHFSIQSEGGKSLDHSAYATVNALPRFDPGAHGFERIDLARVDVTRKDMSKKDVASIERGQKVYQLFGCMACHSVDGTTAGKTGPSWKGLFGSMRPIRGKKPVKADDAYLRKSIVDPAAQIVDGFEQGMPPYLGILSDADVESLVLYIRSL